MNTSNNSRRKSSSKSSSKVTFEDSKPNTSPAAQQQRLPQTQTLALGQIARTPHPGTFFKFTIYIAMHVDDVILKRQETEDAVMKYLLGQVELKKLRELFDHIDINRSGTIDYDEFFDLIEDRRTPFSDNLFRQVDPNCSGLLDFDHFVHILVTYCMKSRDEILQCTSTYLPAIHSSTILVAFDTFDDDCSGTLDENTFIELANTMHEGKPIFSGNFKKALKEYDTAGDGLVTFAAFQQISKRYPMILFPCFRLQDQMQRMSLGIPHWLRIHNRYFEYLSMEVYRKKHNGAAPPIPTIKKLKLLFGMGTYHVYQPT
ncbi:hypothetical protein THRCLA_10009 [Thraustotheca clavata]|uniref:EF-hand domain-containing protein n=1 Tax=Thraustotheca clavata TaxID=74557 RepID=A0A1V9YT49_9STRA|nr:hypothetical protein THRCLA_10009 [Thraustotheca clavata]